jgi:hypothetical protein
VNSSRPSGRHITDIRPLDNARRAVFQLAPPRRRAGRNCSHDKGIFKHMDSPLRTAFFTAGGTRAATLVPVGLAIALLVSAPGAPSALASPHATRSMHTSEVAALLRSRLLWSTIDVCNAPDQPNTVGIRGSMPGDHHDHDMMYMRFRLQYMNAKTKAWTDLAGESPSSYTAVGSGASSRQAGRSFQLSPAAGQAPVTLRGVVSFEWRRGDSVLVQVSRPTSPGRDSLAGADPPGFSAISCVLG